MDLPFARVQVVISKMGWNATPRSYANARTRISTIDAGVL
jgi:hypothetical protein